MLTDRQKLILSMIVEDYVRGAEPVGSRALSKHQEIQLSAATIRNEMADLEELGYLDQPHTSAGRIPSQKGYRFYVDHLLNRREIDARTLAALREVYFQKMNEAERIFHQTATVLSQLTQYTTIVLGPQVHEERIKSIQLVPLTSHTAVAILVTETGQVQSRQVQWLEDISPEDMSQLVSLLNTKLQGVPVSQLRSRSYREIAAEMTNVLEHCENAIAMLDELCAVADSADERLYVGGTTNILAQPEFRDVEKVRPLLALLEEEGALRRVLPSSGSGIQVRIGMENGLEPLQDCTVISATYTIAGKSVGSVGVLGPTRMDYARVMQILDYASRSLTHVMTQRAAEAQE
ncbi:heat-inducible transcription repressor HrcA [Alicyclobacillus cycloheptanicus]|uniref:Heat-inducible transcription repressor HrcA n=1 Tax=Alicyclobacillus cycloheptanicus TaxID=1457 RepID=A0ABT9XL39_9BACL|nr:heat-inducible transcriptional repressor HrcA [Alicyclobacillus cycloheptanicus]MDQ0190488.1 heat-inducible transcriptional repressor [Alicyclobacillus cycloheptanicus]WDM00749.1 heat-inducible transcription repressor HrcA [Alicyclobacillus cycloheptanicus]